MKKVDSGYRGWYYFRNGWSIYFAFIFAAINTLVITYYLAIERVPFLKEVFPSFAFYVIAAVGIGIPLLTIIVNYEANPYEARALVNTEMVLKLSLQLSELLLKKQDSLSEEEINSIKTIMKEIENHKSKRTFTNKLDIKYIRTETQERTEQ